MTSRYSGPGRGRRDGHGSIDRICASPSIPHSGTWIGIVFPVSRRSSGARQMNSETGSGCWASHCKSSHAAGLIILTSAVPPFFLGATSVSNRHSSGSTSSPNCRSNSFLGFPANTQSIGTMSAIRFVWYGPVGFCARDGDNTVACNPAAFPGVHPDCQKQNPAARNESNPTAADNHRRNGFPLRRGEVSAARIAIAGAVPSSRSEIVVGPIQVGDGSRKLMGGSPSRYWC